ncbi:MULTISPECIES: nuclear transport factor 2 family protein [unclassified Pseudofrankia]|uniref:nuclear transport factor 2 family protein n=1 Tax=unclassified Pseudofrankia TaxID=2994372 RepID=UPI0008D96EE0|nr:MULTISPECIES: nuclear transport factor 2 family protein [unclassified Pseudofrankia]MDT3441934.1 nuclear transport factor 2 family protein [Pseudofrankia sp. BMG5.37]OHV44573.1 hypothetical protein BCD48_25290 [Pseudofrankia sp. BMG5.36]
MGDQELAAVRAQLAVLEAREAIRDLAARYAAAVDARDLDTLTGLFVDDVRCANGVGRAALREYFVDLVGRRAPFTTTVHLVAGHVIDLDPADPDAARGTVHCRAEHKVGGHWVVQAMQYSDRYARRDGRWYFRSRRPRSWYNADVLEQPATGDRLKWALEDVGLAPTAELPEIWPTWTAFYAEISDPETTATAE